MKQPRVKVDAHVILWRGLLLIYGCMVFGDTSESVDEVLVHVFYLSILTEFGLTIIFLIFKTFLYEKSINYSGSNHAMCIYKCR